MLIRLTAISLVLFISSAVPAHAANDKAACEKSGGVWVVRPNMSPPGRCLYKIKGEESGTLEKEEITSTDGNGNGVVKFKAGSTLNETVKIAPAQSDGGNVTGTVIINNSKTSAPANDFNSSRSNRSQVVGTHNPNAGAPVSFNQALKICASIPDVDLQSCVDEKSGQRRAAPANDFNSSRSNNTGN